ncbi:MAG TPA: winged helix-turn-helix domain-containing protein [Streptosporangiaceae bacterium]|nr:winged helix-turn-helix domain-containing protein [Streptosporangiaceae bacterium]
MPSDITGPRAKAVQVALILRSAILRGDYPPGEVLPSQRQLAARYHVSEATINRAFAALAAERLVTTGSGQRTLVAALAAYTVTITLRHPRRRYGAKSNVSEPAVSGLQIKQSADFVTWSMNVRAPDPARSAVTGFGVINMLASATELASAEISVSPVA